MNRLIKTLCLICLPLAGLGIKNAEAHPGRDEQQPMVAARITEQNFATAIRGTAAIAGVGDWMLSNGTLCASFSDPEHETYLSHRGGTLVDLGFCGRNDDQWHTYHEMFNLNRDNILPAVQIRSEQNQYTAAIIVKGKMAGIENETRYRMDRENPSQLYITTRLIRRETSDVSASDALFLFGALILHPHRSLTPFVLSSTHRAFSKGFEHPFADTNDQMAMLKVMFPADLHVLVGADHIQPEISYGVQALSADFIDTAGNKTTLRQFAINDHEFTLLGNFTNPLWLDTDQQPGLLQFAQTLVMDLAVGESLLLEKRILVSNRADVASITDQLYSGNIIYGKTDSRENRILVTDNDKRPLTFIKPDPQGLFEFRLPDDVLQAKLLLNIPHHDSVKTLSLPDNSSRFVTLEAEPRTAVLRLPKQKIMRLVFMGINHTADPVFFPDVSNFRVGDKRYERDISTNSIALAGIDQDIDSVALAPGDYIVYATRGPEYSLSKITLHINPNETTTLDINEPERLIATPDWIAADFHVHSEFSFDSTLPIQQRICEFVAQGGEVIVSSEHKRTISYSPFIQQLHLENKIHAITGVEITGMAHTATIPRTIGHSNVFPVIENSMQFLGGTLPHENRRLGEVISAYNKQNPGIVFQLNHPRTSAVPADDINFLDHLSIDKKYNPKLPVGHAENKSLIEQHRDVHYRDIDFDAIELLNGSDMDTYSLVREDWFALLRQGYRKTATANSDSHDARHLVALPRNYVHINGGTAANRKPNGFSQAEFIESIHRGDLFGSTGPLLDIHLEKSGMGETYHGNAGKLRVSVDTVPWININQLSVYVDGNLWHRQSINGRGEYVIPMEFIKDSFVTVEVEGTPGEDYRAVYPGFVPRAFSNPIFVDAIGK